MRFLFFGLAFLSQTAAAQESAGISSAVYLQAFFSMIFILALLIFAAWLMRRLSGGKGFGARGVKVLGGVSLGPRERIVLIEVGEECLVVGIVPGQIRTLHALPKSEIKFDESQKNFAEWLKPLQAKK